MWLLLALGLVFGVIALLDFARLAKRPPGAVRRLFVLRGFAALLGVAGCVAVPAAVDRLLRAGSDWPPIVALGVPIGGIAILLCTQLIHGRRVVSSLAPDQEERFRP